MQQYQQFTPIYAPMQMEIHQFDEEISVQDVNETEPANTGQKRTCKSECIKLHKEDANPQLICLFLVIAILPLIKLANSPMYGENVILDISLSMLHLYWVFNQIWFISQTFQGKQNSQGRKYMPAQNAFDEFIEPHHFDRYSVEIGSCRKCFQTQLLGTVHCDECQRCVGQFSHHSFFYNRCIGEENHLSYTMTMINQFLVLGIYICRVTYFQVNNGWEGLASNIYYFFIFCVLMGTTKILFTELMSIRKNLTVHEYQFGSNNNIESNGFMINGILFIQHHLKNARLKGN